MGVVTDISTPKPNTVDLLTLEILDMPAESQPVKLNTNSIPNIPNCGNCSSDNNTRNSDNNTRNSDNCADELESVLDFDKDFLEDGMVLGDAWASELNGLLATTQSATNYHYQEYNNHGPTTPPAVAV